MVNVVPYSPIPQEGPMYIRDQSGPETSTLAAGEADPDAVKQKASRPKPKPRPIRGRGKARG